MKKLFFIIGLVGLVSLSVSGQKKRELTTQVTWLLPWNVAV